MTRFAWVSAAVFSIAVGLFGLFLLHLFHRTAAVRLVVTNATTRPVDHVAIHGDPLARDEPYLRLTPIPAGETRGIDWRMPTTLGPIWLRVRTPVGTSIAPAGFLLDDDGPYEFRVRVAEDAVSFERDNNEPATWASTMPALMP